MINSFDNSSPLTPKQYETTEDSGENRQNFLNVSYEDYDKLVQRLAWIIRESGWEFDTIVCISRGGLLAGLRLSHLLNKDLGVIAAGSYEGENEMQQGKLSISTHIAIKTNTLGGRILLVDDLTDSGNTLSKVKQNMMKAHQEVQEMRTAVIWTKSCSTFTPDYNAAYIDANIWINQPFEMKPNSEH